MYITAILHNQLQFYRLTGYWAAAMEPACKQNLCFSLRFEGSENTMIALRLENTETEEPIVLWPDALQATN